MNINLKENKSNRDVGNKHKNKIEIKTKNKIEIKVIKKTYIVYDINNCEGGSITSNPRH